MTCVNKAERVPSVEKLFYKKGENELLELRNAEAVDDFVMAWFSNAITSSRLRLTNVFSLRTLELGQI